MLINDFLGGQVPETSSYPEYVGGTEIEDLDRAFSHIARSLMARNAYFLFGAGMSLDSEIPCAPTLLKKLFDTYFPPGINDPPSEERLSALGWEYPFEAAVEAIETKLPRGRLELTEILNEALLDPRFEPSPCHDFLKTVCFREGSTLVDTLFTTNFDMLLERSFGEKAVCVSEKNIQDLQRLKYKGHIPVIHLHGVLDFDYQITESDVYSQNTHSLVATEFKNALAYSDAFVFVGYSMNDPDFRRIYSHYRGDLKARGRIEKKTYSVTPPKDKVSFRFGSDVWAARGATWIPMGAREFFERLAGMMETIALTDAKNELCDAYGVQLPIMDEMVSEISEKLNISSSDAIVMLLSTSRRQGSGE